MLAFLRRHLAAVLGCGAATAIALGVHGFLAMNASTTVATALYRGMQLFYWNYFPWDTTAEAKIPWTLETARWLAPAMTLGTLLHLALALFHRRWNAWCVGRWHGHLLVAGAGKIATTLAKDAARRGKRVVVVGAGTPLPPEAQADGVIALEGSTLDLAGLHAGGADRAARIVIATEDDSMNLALAATIAQQTRTRTATIHARCSDVALCAMFQRQVSTATGSVRLFSEHRNIARQAVQMFPTESATGEAHVFLPSLERLGLALALEHALVGHFSHDRQVTLHVVGPNAERMLADLRLRFPSIDRCLQLHAIEASESEFPAAVAHRLAGLPADAMITIYAGWENEAHGLATTLALHEEIGERPALRIVTASSPDGPARTLTTAHAGLRDRVGFLPGAEECGGYEAIVSETLDRTARAIHEHWLAETRRQIEAARAAGHEALAQRHEAKATFRPWDALTEEQKGANRSQADHLAVKVRSAGLDPQTVSSAAWSQLSSAQVETLARMEHARWAAYLWMTGWRHGETRDDTRKRHPNLVPYDALDDATKDYDRDAVRHVADYLPLIRNGGPRSAA